MSPHEIVCIKCGEHSCESGWHCGPLCTSCAEEITGVKEGVKRYKCSDCGLFGPDEALFCIALHADMDVDVGYQDPNFPIIWSICNSCVEGYDCKDKELHQTQLIIHAAVSKDAPQEEERVV